jgi:putative transposase
MTFGKPPRLDWIFQRYDPPLYFVTLCTARRKKLLANEITHRALIRFGERGVGRNVALGRYVMMPDHIHLFVRGGPEFQLGIWVRGLKRVVAAAVTGGRGSWAGSGVSPPAASDGGSYNASDGGSYNASDGGSYNATGSCNLWQRGFFDHLLRNSESYAQKWNYVWENPVRAGLASKVEDWPFAGEIVEIDRV